MSGRGVSTKEIRVWREACEGRVSVWRVYEGWMGWGRVQEGRMHVRGMARKDE